ncbi:MAG: metal transporter ATPase, partial [Firmicutes bacterium]|nr:metal transporter ATPase [Bacillota bacterium]
RRAAVNPDTGSLLVLYDPTRLSVDELADRLGLAQPAAPGHDQVRAAAAQTLLTGAALTAVTAKRMLIGPSALSRSMVTWDLAGLITVFASYPFLRSGLEELFRRGRLSGELVLGAAGLGATVLRENVIGLAVLFLASLNELLFARTIQSCEEASARLVHPEERAGQGLQPGQLIRIHNGQHIPVAGVITGGSGLVDESRLSGQWGVHRASPGAHLRAGARLVHGELVLRITATPRVKSPDCHGPRHDMLIADGHTRGSARWGLIAVGASLLTWITTGSGRRALAALIAAAPAAATLAAVLPLNAATAAAARRGIVTKGAHAVAAAAKVDTVLFDKTGTLTSGHPAVVALVPATPDHSTADVLQLAASAEEQAVHPFAAAIRSAAHNKGLPIPEAQDHREWLGQGAAATVAGHRIAVGSEAFIATQCTLSPSASSQGMQLHAAGHSVVYVACDGVLIGLIGVADAMRPEVARTLTLIRSSGVNRCGMATGDHDRTARPVATRLGLSGCWASAGPEAKADLIRTLQAAGHTVALVGDGLNDAPGLAAADLGIAVGRGHASVTLAAADAVIADDDLCKVGEFIHLGRRAARGARENQLLAACLNAAGLWLAASGTIGPVGASLWHNVTSLTVIINAMRILPR